ncbi:MAG: hypothetical protein ACN6N0_12175, partial [Microvirgula sp.]
MAHRHLMKLSALCMLAALTACQKTESPAASPAASTAAPAAPDFAEQLVGPVADYKLYVSAEVDELVKQTQRFADAIKAGKLEE